MIIDLTHTVTDSMPVYPGDPKATLRQVAAIGKEGYADHWLSIGMHVGTHLDAPAHMIAGGKKVNELPLELFCGRGVAVDVRGKSTLNNEVCRGVRIRKGDIVLFCTGFSKKYRSPEYFTDYPVMTEALARELARRKIHMVGFDAPSPDRAPFAVHKIFLGTGILIIENLTNLEKLLGVPQFEVRAFPQKIAADAAPVRVVAFL